MEIFSGHDDKKLQNKNPEEDGSISAGNLRVPFLLYGEHVMLTASTVLFSFLVRGKPFGR
jgi:hypothetical protein